MRGQEARQEGENAADAQQSHPLAAASGATQPGGATQPPRRITADSFRMLSERLKTRAEKAAAASAVVTAPVIVAKVPTASAITHPSVVLETRAPEPAVGPESQSPESSWIPPVEPVRTEQTSWLPASKPKVEQEISWLPSADAAEPEAVSPSLPPEQPAEPGMPWLPVEPAKAATTDESPWLPPIESAKVEETSWLPPVEPKPVPEAPWLPPIETVKTENTSPWLPPESHDAAGPVEKVQAIEEPPAAEPDTRPANEAAEARSSLLRKTNPSEPPAKIGQTPMAPPMQEILDAVFGERAAAWNLPDLVVVPKKQQELSGPAPSPSPREVQPDPVNERPEAVDVPSETVNPWLEQQGQEIEVKSVVEEPREEEIAEHAVSVELQAPEEFTAPGLEQVEQSTADTFPPELRSEPVEVTPEETQDTGATVVAEIDHQQEPVFAAPESVAPVVVEPVQEVVVPEPVAAEPQVEARAEEISAPPVQEKTSVARQEAEETPPTPRREKSLLRRRATDRIDPFGDSRTSVSPPAMPIEIGEPDPVAGETAKSLIDIMSVSATISQPQERALAADTLLRLIPRVPEKTLATLADRIAIMETPPPMLVTRLIRDPRPEVAGPLLEKAPHIPDRDLITVISEGDVAKIRMIARRRHISPALVDALIATKDASVLLTLVRNAGATPSHEAFHDLCQAAIIHSSLQAPLVTRHDTPVPAAFELFWFLPAELRRFVLSRFLTDSENLNRILKIVLSTGDGKAPESFADAPFPERQQVEALVELLVDGRTEEATSKLMEMAQICEVNARRIIADEYGEPLTIAFKVMGLSRAKFADAITALQASPTATLRKDRNPQELQSIFDSMSFNKARVLLTYWDWAAQKSGPYTQLAA